MIVSLQIANCYNKITNYGMYSKFNSTRILTAVEGTYSMFNGERWMLPEAKPREHPPLTIKHLLCSLDRSQYSLYDILSF